MPMRRTIFEPEHEAFRDAARRFFQAVLAVARVDHLVAMAHQRDPHHAPDLRVVVDHQDTSRTQAGPPPEWGGTVK